MKNLMLVQIAALFSIVLIVSCATRPIPGSPTGAVERSAFAETMSLIGDSVTGLVGVRTFEQPDYDVVLEDGAFEVREYAELAVIRATEADGGDGGQAFGRLFRYLGGDNDRDQKVAMTAPVLMRESDADMAMDFILPGKYSADSAPAPDDASVQRTSVEGGRFATVRFSGTLADARVEQKTAALRAWMDENGLVAIDDPLVAGYDPPFTLPALRRNEVWIRVR